MLDTNGFASYQCSVPCDHFIFVLTCFLLQNELSPDSVASRKPKVRKKDNSASSSGPSIPSSQGLFF